MKKINLPLAATLALFAALTFSSCKKDYTCACQVIVPFLFDTTVNVEMEDFTKKQAKKACENNDETIKQVTSAMIAKALQSFMDSFSQAPVVIPPGIVSATCELK
jgi:hypothetical protein